jgi:hypothetical protein
MEYHHVHEQCQYAHRGCNAGCIWSIYKLIRPPAPDIDGPVTDNLFAEHE